MAFENFPYTNFHEINLDWIVARVKEAYSASNPPDYPVKSVNGMTGDVIIAIPANLVSSVNGETGDVVLYRNPLTQFPATDEQRWNLFRICDGDERGIEFDEDGAHRIEGTRRILIYDEENQPDYPVTSVNGQTGDVRITAGVNSVNGKTGNVVTPFVNPNTDILKLDSNSNTILWGISRDVAGGNVALYMSTGGTNPQAFIRFTPDDGEAINLPLLSSADIPESAGVVSVNGAVGVVTLYGTNINTNDTSELSITTKLESINKLALSLPSIMMVENTTVSWGRGGYYANTGVGFGSTKIIRTQDLPTNIDLITQKSKEIQLRLYAFENDTYVGIYHEDSNTFTPEDSNNACGISTSINLKKIRQSYPEYSFKLTANLYPMIEITGQQSLQYIGLYTLQNEDISQLEENVEALQASDTTQNQQISALQTSDTSQNQQISALQTSDTTQNQQISALQAADTAHNQQIASLQSADATHDQQISALQAKDTTQDQQISELYTRTGIYGIFIENVNSLPLRYPASGTDAKIKSTNVVVSMDLYVSAVQVDDWTINTYDGYLEITGTMNGTSSMTLYLA